MAFTNAEINQISGSRTAVRGKQYIDNDGNIWVGTTDNRLKRTYLRDTNIGVKVDDSVQIQSLKDFIKNLTLPLISNFQTEIDFGSELHINQKEFTITNSKVRSYSIIQCSVAYDAPTGKDLDELEMDVLEVKAGAPTDGSFKLLVTGTEGSISGKFKINYSV